MRVYLAGPMTGISGFNARAFDHAALSLRNLGHTVWSPVENDRAMDVDLAKEKPEIDEALRQKLIRMDLMALLTCECLALLPGWKRSRGALLERKVAEACGLRIWELAL